MRRSIIFMLAIVVAGAAYGQKKPKINQAEKARISGELGEAKDIIDRAAEYEKLKDDGKTWYYRGLVYSSLDTTSNPDFQNLANDPLKIAMESFEKADELSNGKTEYYITNSIGIPVTKTQQIGTLWSYYLNKGVENYNAKDNKKAYDYFTKTTVVMPEDTTGYIYAASVAQADKNYDAALSNYEHLVNVLDYKTKSTFYSMIYIAGTVQEDNEKALKYVKAARVAFPEDQDLAKSEINILIKLERVDEAQAELEAAIAKEPDNPNLKFTLGVMYEEIGDVAKAKEAYKSSLEADPSYLNSAFNLAVIVYNQAVDLIKAKNNLGISKADQVKAKAMQSDIDKSLKEALPYWEKVNELQPNDRTALETLQYIYTQQKKYDEAEAIAAQLDKLGEGQ